MIANATTAITNLFHNPVTQKLSSIIHSDTTKKVMGAAHVAFGMLAVALKSHYIGIALLLIGIAIFVVKKPTISKLFLLSLPFISRSNPPASQSENHPLSPPPSPSVSKQPSPTQVTVAAAKEDQPAEALPSESTNAAHPVTSTEAVPSSSPTVTAETSEPASSVNAATAGESAKTEHHHRHREKSGKKTPRPDHSGQAESTAAGTDAKPSSHRKKHRRAGDDAHPHAKSHIEKDTKEAILQPPGLDTEATSTAHPVEHEIETAAPERAKTADHEELKKDKKEKKSSLPRFLSFSKKSKPAVSTPRIDTDTEDHGAKKNKTKVLAKSHSEIHSREKRDDTKKPKAS